MCVVTVFVPPKRLLFSTKPHGVTSQKNTALKLTTVGTSSLSLSIINVRLILLKCLPLITVSVHRRLVGKKCHVTSANE